MTKPLRVLIVEDNEDDATLLVRTLRHGGFDPVYTRVDNARDLRAALSESPWEMIICDHAMPQFDSFAALALVKETGFDMPFIVVSGMIGEEVAVATMKAGAHDYLMKDKLLRLVPAIERELHEAEERRQRRQTEEALQESEARYRVLVEQSLAGIYIIQEGRFRYVNPKFAEIFGYTPDEIITTVRQGHDLFAEENRAWVQARLLAREQGEVESDSYAFRGQRKDGTLIEVEIHGSTMTLGGKPAVIGILLDITERTQMEEARQHLEEQLRQSQKMEALGTLAGGVAHEFNNILAGMLGYTDLTQDAVPQDSVAWNYLQEVLTAGRRAKDLVQQILAFSHRSEIRREPLPFHRIIHEALTLLRVSLPTTIAFQTHVEQDVGTVLADRTQMHQIIINLCTNADHAMRETGGILEVRLDTVEVDEARATRHPGLHPGPHVRFTVQDTGPGIAPKVLERIFDPFFTTKGVGEGTGMGLAIVHGIVTSHGGAVTVESTVGAGTTFTIYLPQWAETAAGETVQPEEDLLQGTGCILFVDDEVMLANLGHTVLEQLGYEVVSCTSSLEAFEAFRGNPQRFDLVITDQTMPQLTGEQLATALRRMRPDIPIIVCTGFSHVINAEKAQALGIDAFCMKPLRIRELAVTIQQVLAKRAAQGAQP